MKNSIKMNSNPFFKKCCIVLLFLCFSIKGYCTVFQNKIKQDTLLNKLNALNSKKKYKPLLKQTTKLINAFNPKTTNDSLYMASLYYYQFEANYYLKNYLESITSATSGINFCPNNKKGAIEKGKLYYKKAYGESKLNYAKRSENSMKIAIDYLSIKNDASLDFLVDSYVFLSTKYAYYGDLKNAKYYLRLAENIYQKNKIVLDKITTDKNGNAHRYEIVLLYRKIYLLYKLAKNTKDSTELLLAAKKINKVYKTPEFNRREEIYYSTALNHIGDWYISYKEDSLITKQHLKQGNYYLDKSIDLIENKKFRGDYFTFKYNKCKSYTKDGALKKANSLILHLLDSLPKNDYRRSFFLAQKGLIKAKLQQKDSALLTFFKSIETIHSDENKLLPDYSNFKPSKTFGETRLIRRIAEKLTLFYGEDDNVKNTIAKLYEIAFIQFKNSYAKSKFNPKENNLLRKILYGILIAKNQNKLENLSIKKVLSDIEMIANRMSWQQFYQNRYTNSLPKLDSLKNRELKLRKVLAIAKKNTKITKQDSIKQLLNKHVEFTEKQYPNLNQLSNKEFNLSELQKKLQDDELLIKYLILDSYIAIFSITNTKIDWEIKPFNEVHKNKIKSIVSELKSRRDTNNNLTELGAYLLPKISNTVKNIIINPDGEIYKIPFELLRLNNRFIVRDYNIKYASNLNLVSFKEQNNKTTKFELAIYTPTYKENELKSITRSRSANLFGAKKESEVISKLFKSKVYLKGNLSKEHFFKTAPNASLLHLAMHAEINTEDSGLSKLIFNKEKDNLYLEELYALKLKADLAVLSACNTGVGNENSGRSLESFQRAFMFAGVPATVASLWEVPDVSTSEIMESFYKYLKKGKTKSYALRKAKLDYLNKYKGTKLAQPYYWAGFVLYGSHSPIKENNSNVLWFTLILIFLIIIVRFKLKSNRIKIID